MSDSFEFVITPELVEEFRREFAARDKYRVLENALANAKLEDVALRRDVVTAADHTFSVKLDDWKVTDQKRSGRCWMFAGLNLLRYGAMKKMNVKDFEFSQNYVLFHDKLERANYFLGAVLETAHLPVEDRTVAFLLDNVLGDGGQWNMFVNIVKKYGLAPKSAMPETESSSNTGPMNSILVAKLREYAAELRDMAGRGAGAEEIAAARKEMLGVVHRILCMHLGTPPERFLWQWHDKDGEFHRDGVLTPHEFAERYVTIPLDEYVCLVNDPRPDNPFGRTYTVRFLGNVEGGERVVYLNVDIETMKKTAMRALESGEPVWFGCDVGKMMHRKLGLWDAKLFDYEEMYDTAFRFDKAQRLLYHSTQMTHAMLFTGVDIVDGKPRRWRVENSWGEEGGAKGFYLMNDNWFDEYMFEIAARKSLLPAELLEALEAEPAVLPPWDPMGSLAR